ncbi:MAG: Plasmid stabilization system protein [Syntrophorhabdus sp. PtaU1.Bin058]|nr:MAG: Plasmid stabilization system protein [Syntrophorhabdus sp. PtaU1.Bin058]
MFEVVYAKSVEKDIKNIPSRFLYKIKEEIEHLTEFPQVKNIKKLTNHPVSDFRLKVGDYRVLFDVDIRNRAIYTLKIGHRKEVY